MLIGIIQFIVLIFSLIVGWLFIRPYLRVPQKRNLILKGFLILGIASAVGYLTVYFITKEPEGFSNGVELLKNNKEISSKIGYCSSYSYYEKYLSKDTDNPYEFKVQLTGSLATMYVSCKVSKDNLGKWHLIEIKQDSLVKAKGE